MFHVRGNFKGREVVVTWDAGELTCDDDVRHDIDMLMVRDGRVGLPTGPFTYEDHLSSPLSALILITGVLDVDPPLVFSGDVPDIPTVPDGAIP